MVAAGQVAGASPVVQALAVGNLNQPVSGVCAGDAAIGGLQPRVAGQRQRCDGQRLPVAGRPVQDNGSLAQVAVECLAAGQWPGVGQTAGEQQVVVAAQARGDGLGHTGKLRQAAAFGLLVE